MNLANVALPLAVVFQALNIITLVKRVSKLEKDITKLKWERPMREWKDGNHA